MALFAVLPASSPQWICLACVLPDLVFLLDCVVAVIWMQALCPVIGPPCQRPRHLCHNYRFTFPITAVPPILSPLVREAPASKHKWITTHSPPFLLVPHWYCALPAGSCLGTQYFSSRRDFRKGRRDIMGRAMKTDTLLHDTHRSIQGKKPGSSPIYALRCLGGPHPSTIHEITTSTSEALSSSMALQSKTE